ncbi:hypothetical protein TNCT_212841 [Trichonephila clavata]|uniref:Uncharacterized protein n=1 Tax=Trichonephila clavata TaxID=2740835 RepID=A0A8X6J2D8_TRICU|nr:hypothetical protein TNCT_212841 [Trichonephila clavata]
MVRYHNAQLTLMVLLNCDDDLLLTFKVVYCRGAGVTGIFAFYVDTIVEVRECVSSWQDISFSCALMSAQWISGTGEVTAAESVSMLFSSVHPFMTVAQGRILREMKENSNCMRCSQVVTLPSTGHAR